MGWWFFVCCCCCCFVSLLLQGIPLLLLLFICSAYSAGTRKSVDAYIVTPNFSCRGALCPEVALETLRFLPDLSYPFEKEKKRLATLIAPSDPRRMHFGAVSAFEASSRTLFVAASGVSGLPSSSSLLFVQTLASDLSNVSFPFGAPPDSLNFSYPSASLVSLETMSGALLAVFADGHVAQVQLPSGALVSEGSLLPSGPGADGRYVVCTSTDQEGHRLFAITANAALNRDYQVVTMNLTSGKVTTQPCKSFGIPPFFWDLSTVFQHRWIPTINRLVVFSSGLFDTLFYLNPIDGTGSYCIQDLSQVGYKFRDSPNTFDSDMWNNCDFDPVSNSLYFQTTVNEEFGAIQIVHLTFPPNSKPEKKSYIDQDAEVQFGFSNLKYIRCAGQCEQPQ